MNLSKSDRLVGDVFVFASTATASKHVRPDVTRTVSLATRNDDAKYLADGKEISMPTRTLISKSFGRARDFGPRTDTSGGRAPAKPTTVWYDDAPENSGKLSSAPVCSRACVLSPRGVPVRGRDR